MAADNFDIVRIDMAFLNFIRCIFMNISEIIHIIDAKTLVASRQIISNVHNYVALAQRSKH